MSDEPDAYWGHLPVYIASLDKEFTLDVVIGSVQPTSPFDPIQIILAPEWDHLPQWHLEQAQHAVTDAIQLYPDAMEAIPQGFYLSLTRRRYVEFTERDGASTARTHVSGTVTLYESIHALQTKQRISRAEYRVGDEWHSGPLKLLASNFNPYPELLRRLADRLSTHWERWLTQRRRKRWKPVPEWLVQLRASRKRRAGSTASTRSESAMTR
jgi:hypothetical protein